MRGCMRSPAHLINRRHAVEGSDRLLLGTAKELPADAAERGARKCAPLRRRAHTPELPKTRAGARADKAARRYGARALKTVAQRHAVHLARRRQPLLELVDDHGARLAHRACRDRAVAAQPCVCADLDRAAARAVLVQPQHAIDRQPNKHDARLLVHCSQSVARDGRQHLELARHV
eukprot:151495-Chlamydomonas_euryale.AAC.3